MTPATRTDGVRTGELFTHSARAHPSGRAQPPGDHAQGVWRAAWRHRATWAMAAVLIVSAVLIASLYSVLLRTVQESDQRRQDAAAYADAHWRCHNELDLAHRRRCLAQIKAALFVDAKAGGDARTNRGGTRP